MFYEPVGIFYNKSFTARQRNTAAAARETRTDAWAACPRSVYDILLRSTLEIARVREWFSNVFDAQMSPDLSFYDTPLKCIFVLVTLIPKILRTYLR